MQFADFWRFIVRTAVTAEYRLVCWGLCLMAGSATSSFSRSLSKVVRFGSFETNLDVGELRKFGHLIHLRYQSFQVLAALLENAGRVVTREQLCSRLWHGEVFVDFENNLNAVVARLRQALCDTAEHPHFIETLPKRGYRFIAPVEWVAQASVRDAKPTKNLDAYHEYIQGRHIMDTVSLDRFVAARQHFERAIALDPLYADAYDGLAELCWYLGYFGLMPPRRAFSVGIVHALRALEIDNDRAETHALLGQFHKIAEYNWDEVEREMHLALQLDPDSPVVRTRYAVSHLMPHGHLSQAIVELERALQVDPLAVKARGWLGIMLLLSRRFEEAIELSGELLDIDPMAWPAYFTIGSGHHYLGHASQAIAAMRNAVMSSGGGFCPLAWLGMLLAAHGETGEARSILQGLHARASEEYVPPTSMAWIYLGLKEIDLAFEWMDRAVEDCDQLMMPIKTYGFFDPLRSDVRYVRLLRKMNLD
jgi:DNA-binding winged helix-turn-helix (wHTH) protein